LASQLPTRPHQQHSVQSLVFAALRVLINKHPILGAIPLGKHKSTPYCARLSSIDSHTCTLFVTRKKSFFPTEVGEVDEELDALLESQHKHDWRGDVGTKPFWRVIVAKLRNEALHCNQICGQKSGKIDSVKGVTLLGC
jgi:hypothetical protein